MTNQAWRKLPPGSERKAARARYFADRERAKPISAHCPIKKVNVGGKTGWRGPSRVVHYFENEAQEQVAIRLARTRSMPFPHDLLTADLGDGQLVLGCKTRSYRLPITPELPPRFFEITVDHLAEVEREYLASRSDISELPNAGTEPVNERTDNV